MHLAAPSSNRVSDAFILRPPARKENSHATIAATATNQHGLALSYPSMKNPAVAGLVRFPRTLVNHQGAGPAVCRPPPMCQIRRGVSRHRIVTAPAGYGASLLAPPAVGQGYQVTLVATLNAPACLIFRSTSAIARIPTMPAAKCAGAVSISITPHSATMISDQSP